MKLHVQTLLIAGLFSMPLMAGAQSSEDQNAPETPPVTAPVQENFPTEPAEQPGQAQNPTDVVYEVHGDWQVRCAADDPQNCFLYQLGKDDSGNPVAEFNLVQLQNEGQAVAGITIVTPLGTNLGRGLKWRIDSSEPRTYPYSWCAQVGCFARFGMTDAQINGMKRGANGFLALSAIQNPDAEINLSISLTGFTAAYDTLKEVIAQKAE